MENGSSEAAGRGDTIIWSVVPGQTSHMVKQIITF